MHVEPFRFFRSLHFQVLEVSICLDCHSQRSFLDDGKHRLESQTLFAFCTALVKNFADDLLPSQLCVYCGDGDLA